MVDAGKGYTKGGTYQLGRDRLIQKRFVTRYSCNADFDDDNLENQTFLFDIDGETYKIGYSGDVRTEATSSKLSEIHKVCYYASIAMSLSCYEDWSSAKDTCVDFGNVICGFSIPTSFILEPEVVRQYREFVFNDLGKQHKVRLKLKAGGPVREFTFTIVAGHIFPEGVGAGYGLAAQLPDVYGIVDIGYFNTSITYYQAHIPYPRYSNTYELGYQNLCANIGSGLSKELKTSINEDYINIVMQRPRELRYLQSQRDPEGSRALSEKVFKAQSDSFIEQILRKLKENEWPIDYMQLIFIGGTSLCLKDTIREKFGNAVTIPDDAHYIHVNGCLQKLALMHGCKINKEIAKANAEKGEGAIIPMQQAEQAG